MSVHGSSGNHEGNHRYAKAAIVCHGVFEAMLCGQMGQNLVVWRKNVTTHHDYNFILNVKQDGGVSQL